MVHYFPKSDSKCSLDKVIRNCLIMEKDPWLFILFSVNIFQEELQSP